MKRFIVAIAAVSSLAAAQTTNYVYDTTTNSTAASTSNNTNTNNSVSTSTNTNTNTNYNYGDVTNRNINTSTSTSSVSTVNTNNDTSVSTVTSTQTVASNATTNNTNVNKNVSDSTSYSESVNRQVIDQNLKSPPPSAIAPSMMSYSQDLCTTGMSGAVQTQIIGISAGKAVRDSNCERIKLSKTLWDMGMKVAGVSLLCQDDRVFRAMEMAGTPCPYMGKIGVQATAAWEENKSERPDKGKKKN